MRIFGYIAAFVLLVAVLIGVGFGTRLINLESNKYFAPKEAAVQREVFQNTPSYRQGMVQELRNMQFAYNQADATHRGGLASVALHRVGDVADPNALPSDVQQFVSCLRRSQTNNDFSEQCS